MSAKKICSGAFGFYTPPKKNVPKGDLVMVFAFRGLNIAASLVSLLCSPFEASLGLCNSLYLWILAIAFGFNSQSSGLVLCSRYETLAKEVFHSVFAYTSLHLLGFVKNQIWQTSIWQLENLLSLSAQSQPSKRGTKKPFNDREAGLGSCGAE